MLKYTSIKNTEPHLPKGALAAARGPHDDDADALFTREMQLQDLVDLQSE